MWFQSDELRRFKGFHRLSDELQGVSWGFRDVSERFNAFQIFQDFEKVSEGTLQPQIFR